MTLSFRFLILNYCVLILIIYIGGGKESIFILKKLKIEEYPGVHAV